MKSLITLFVLGLIGVAMVGCETTEKKKTVRYDDGSRTVKTTTVEKVR